MEEGFKSGTSKKDAELRVSELREGVLPLLKTDMESDPQFWLSNKSNMLLAVAVLSIGKIYLLSFIFVKSILMYHIVVIFFLLLRVAVQRF